MLLDVELARIYGVETRVLNQAVKRNAERFPEGFRFQLNAAEAAVSRSQSVILKTAHGQNVKVLPYAFTEHGAIEQGIDRARRKIIKADFFGRSASNSARLT
jgi:hypothetical protein